MGHLPGVRGSAPHRRRLGAAYTPRGHRSGLLPVVVKGPPLPPTARGSASFRLSFGRQGVTSGGCTPRPPTRRLTRYGTQAIPACGEVANTLARNARSIGIENH